MTDYSYKYNDRVLILDDEDWDCCVRTYVAPNPKFPKAESIIFNHLTGAVFIVDNEKIKPKPKTRTINGIEVPAPIPSDFNFKNGEKYFHICSFSPTKIGSISYKELNHRFASANEMLYYTAQDAKENLQAIELTSQREK